MKWRLLLIPILYFLAHCGGSSPPSLTITVTDAKNNPVEGAFVQAGLSTLTNTTNSSGQVTFQSDVLKDPQIVSVGKSGYRNLTIWNAAGPQVTATLTELTPPHGYIRSSIEDSTWAPLVDNCGAPPPCIIRFALIWIPTDDITTVYNITDCDSCLAGGLGIIPFDPNQQTQTSAAGLDQPRVFAVAGLLDTATFTFTMSKFGIADFSIDATNTAANPKDVVIPLAYDLSDTTAVTLNVNAAKPAGTDQLFEILALNLPDHGFSLMEGILGLNIGGTKISDTSYSFRGLIADNIAAEPLLAGASYFTALGYSNASETAESWYIGSFPITNSTQTVSVDTLLDLPQNLIPSDATLLDPAGTVPLSWDAVAGTNVYYLSIASPFFNGTTLGGRIIWEFIVPSTVTSITLPTLLEDGLPELEACNFYRYKAYPLLPTGYDFNAGTYPRLQDFFFNMVPTLHSMNTTTFFTSGENCGPLISNLGTTDVATGDELAITGMYFGATQGTSTVMFDSTEAAAYTSWSDQSIVVNVPAAAAGVMTLNVVVNGVNSNTAYVNHE